MKHRFEVVRDAVALASIPFDYARSHQLCVIVICPYVPKWLKRHLSGKGNLYWTNGNDRYDREPGANVRRGLAISIASRLPIEWLL